MGVSNLGDRHVHRFASPDPEMRSVTKQETLSQWENPNYGNYTLRTLKKLAAAFDVGLLVRFVPFSELIHWTVRIKPERLAPPSFTQELAAREMVEH